jgi:DNA-directed RNA polymerase subunit RPC12/RpoP
MGRRPKEPVVICPRCRRRMATKEHKPMGPKQRKAIRFTDSLVEVAYVCESCGTEIKTHDKRELRPPQLAAYVLRPEKILPVSGKSFTRWSWPGFSLSGRSSVVDQSQRRSLRVIVRPSGRSTVVVTMRQFCRGPTVTPPEPMPTVTSESFRRRSRSRPI